MKAWVLWIGCLFFLLLGILGYGQEAAAPASQPWSTETWFLIGTIAFAALSEIIGATPLKANGVIQLILQILGGIFRKPATKILIIIPFLVVLGGCATMNVVATPEQKVLTYEEAGKYLATFGNIFKTNCKGKAIDDKTCMSVRITYNKARSAYRAAGDAQIAELSSKTVESLADAQKRESEAMAKLSMFIVDLRKYEKGGK